MDYFRVINKVGRWLVNMFCAYELVSNNSKGRAPTLSLLSKKARKNPLTLLLVIFLYSWLTYHIFFEKLLPALETVEQALDDLGAMSN
jgi:hypothetical protein